MSILMKGFSESKGDEIALVDDNRSISWKDFDKRVNSLVNGLRKVLQILAPVTSL